MWEADFGAIHSTIPHAFEESEVVGILGIEDNLINGVLQVWFSADVRVKVRETLP